MALYWRENLDDALDTHLTMTARWCGTSPDPQLVREAVASASNPEPAIDRFLFEWENANGYSAAMTPPPDDGYLAWFDPTAAGPTAVALMPSGDPVAVHAFVSSLYGAPQDLVAALARGWFDRYGAEPAALWGTMIEFYVTRPPTDLEEAWTLAREQALIAPDTLVGPGITRRQHARALLGRGDWFLHSRP